MSGCPFDIGDVVVCVDASRPPVSVIPGDEDLVAKGLAFLSNGRCYRVAAMSNVWRGGIHLQGDPMMPRACYNWQRFRKIDADVTEGFRHAMRSIKQRKPVTA